MEQGVAAGAVWTTADYALIVSLCSASIALVSLAWNIWSKFIYPKAKLRSSAGYFVDGPAESPGTKHFVILSAVNLGPTEATIKLIIGRGWRWHSAISRSFESYLIKHWGSRQTRLPPIELPKKVPVGEEVTFYFDPTDEVFTDGKEIQLGFLDSFGRKHWIPRRKMSEVRGRSKTSSVKLGSGKAK